MDARRTWSENYRDSSKDLFYSFFSCYSTDVYLSIQCSVDTVVCVEFHPLDRSQIVTAGKNHLAFWTLDHNGTLYKRMGVFEGREKPKYVTCIAFTQGGDVISGDSNGNVIVWGRGTNTIVRFFR